MKNKGSTIVKSEYVLMPSGSSVILQVEGGLSFEVGDTIKASVKDKPNIWMTGTVTYYIPDSSMLVFTVIVPHGIVGSVYEEWDVKLIKKHKKTILDHIKGFIKLFK